MKRVYSLLLAVLLAFGALTMQPATLTLANDARYGDANEDGAINAADALTVLRVAVGKQTLSAELTEFADVDDSGTVNAADALLILRYAVNRIDRFPADKGTIEPPPTPTNKATEWVGLSTEQTIQKLDAQSQTPSEIQDAYALHEDGGLIYNPLSRELSQDERTKYNALPKTTGKLTLADGATLTYSLPTDVTAYDMVPIEYSVANASANAEPLYVEATTFEETNDSYYDLCLPGNVSLKFEYLGYQSATNNVQENRPFLSKDFRNDQQGKKYPQYEMDSDDIIPSDTVPSGRYVWFTFRITNTGNTILENDGNGSFCFEPLLRDASGTNTVRSVANLYYRLTETLYPGESTDLTVYFGESSGMSLAAGDYNILINCLVRNEQSGPDWPTKIWGGYNYGSCNKAITVADNPTVTKKSEATFTPGRTMPTRNTWLHTYEEFTTSYDSWTLLSQLKAGETHTLWVQPAAWSDHVALKFMRGNRDTLRSVNIPLKIDTDSLSIQLNQTAENFIITDEGTKYPAMASQSMCDMRVNDSLSPYSNEAQLNELLDMKECGINLVTTTEAFNYAGGSKPPSTTVGNAADAIWFVSDVLRKLGMRMEGYTGYPFSASTNVSAAYWYSGDRAVVNSGNILADGYGGEGLGLANGLRGLYQFMRWGDNFYVNGKGKTVFNTEDTRGWMRIDFNARTVMSSASKANFQDWLQRKYTTIGRLNAAWSKTGLPYNYTSFAEIDPEEGTSNDHDWRKYDIFAKLPEWSPALNDLDEFRTLERTGNYETVLDTLKNYGTDVKPSLGAASVDATMGIRTEGGNITGVVDPNEGRSHLRHAYYSQRRCGIIPQLLAASGTVSMHSDYVTLPYSVSELEALVASSVTLGITPMPLMQADRMRDIAINAKWGDGNYAMHYNMIGDNICGAYINTQVSLFQSFKAIYENGGIPGVLWEDYLCDGYVTETQQKEMKFFSSKIAEMMQTPEAQKWATTNVPDVQSIYATSKGAYSYPESYIQAEIDKALAARQ